MHRTLWAALVLALVCGGCNTYRAPRPVQSPEGARPAGPDWPDEYCPQTPGQTARGMLEYIIEFAPPGAEGYYAGERAAECLNDPQGYLGQDVSGCGSEGQSCCFCVYLAHGYAVRRQWQQCAAKLGHGHGGSGGPP
jgi:hypothetical protein